MSFHVDAWCVVVLLKEFWWLLCSFHRSRIELPLGFLLNYSRVILLYMEVPFHTHFARIEEDMDMLSMDYYSSATPELIVRRLCCYYLANDGSGDKYNNVDGNVDNKAFRTICPFQCGCCRMPHCQPS
jgi:hypothetical protein